MQSKRSLHNKDIIRHLLLVGITLTILYFLFRSIDIKELSKQIANAKLVYIGLAFFLSLGFVFLSALRWKMLINAMGYKINFLRCQKVTLATFTLNVIIPSKGGDFVKSSSLKDIVPIAQGFGIVILERLIDLILLCSMAFAGSVLVQNKKWMIASFIVLVICLGFTVLAKRIGRLQSKGKITEHLKNMGYATRALCADPVRFVLVVLIGVVIWLGSAFQIYLLYQAIGQHIPLMYSIAVIPIAIFIGFIPITIAGMGTRDAVIIFLFSAYASASASIFVGLVFSILRHWVLALIGIPFLNELRGKENEDQ